MPDPIIVDGKTLKSRVDAIIAEQGDNERQHSMEDRLYRELIREFCPKWVVRQIECLNDTYFERWCG